MQHSIVLTHQINYTTAVPLGMVIFSSGKDFDAEELKKAFHKGIRAMLDTHAGELDSVDKYKEIYLAAASMTANQFDATATFIEADSSLLIVP